MPCSRSRHRNSKVPERAGSWQRTACVLGATCLLAACGRGAERPPSAASKSPAAASPAPPTPSASAEPRPRGELEQSVWTWAKEIAGLYEPTEDYRSGELTERGSVDIPVILQSGRCTRVLAAADDSLTDLELTLFDPNGSLARQEAQPGSRASLGVDHSICPPATAAYRIRVTARSGEGAFVLRVYQSPY